MDVLSHCWWFLGTKKWDGLDIFLLYLLVERVSCLLLLCFLFFPPLFLGSSGCLRRMIYLRCFFSREEQTSYFFIDMLIFFLKKTKQNKKQWCFHRGKKTTLSLTVYVEIASFLWQWQNHDMHLNNHVTSVCFFYTSILWLLHSYIPKTSTVSPYELFVQSC